MVFGFFSSTYALCFALANTFVSKESNGVAMGFTNMLCIAFGAPILQPLIGALLKWSANPAAYGKLKAYSLHDYNIALIPLPVCLFIAFILAFFAKEGPKEDPKTLKEY